MSVIDHDTQRHRFSTSVDGYEAVLDYSLNDGVMTISHTEVPEAISGRGIASDLVSAAVIAARSAPWTINPTCSYAAAYLRRHPEANHTLATDSSA